MESLVCNASESKHQELWLDGFTPKRWQVSYKNRNGEIQTDVLKGANNTLREVFRLQACGIECKVMPCLTDVYIVGTCGTLVLIASGCDPNDAAYSGWEYSQIDRSDGYLLWPHGSPLPSCFEVAKPVGEDEVVA
jgi:hypothetical protein